MNGNMNTEYGRVTVDDRVIAKVAGITALECFGIVGMASAGSRDGLVRLLTKDKLTKGIEVEIKKNEIYLTFHIIVVYGVAISAVADNLISNVTYAVEALTGLKVVDIKIRVEGVRKID